MKIITFLTDFGTADSYVAQMKGVASSLSDARLIDITHDIRPHHIREAAFLLQTIVPYYPLGSVHVVVVDPGVGTSRKGLLITTKTQILVGPDNGVLLPAAHFLGEFTVYEIINKTYLLDTPSNTFHGRDVFTPVAAHITNGVPFDQIGQQTTEYIDLNLGNAEITEQTVEGKIVYIDRFGNLITNIPWYRLRDVFTYGKTAMVFLGSHSRTMPFVQTYGLAGVGEPLLTIGSSNYLEISMNQGNASELFSVKEDDDVKLLFK